MGVLRRHGVSGVVMGGLGLGRRLLYMLIRRMTHGLTLVREHVGGAPSWAGASFETKCKRARSDDESDDVSRTGAIT